MRNSSVFIAVVLFCINIVSYADDSCPGCFVGRPEIEKHLIPLSKALILEKCRELSLPQEENLDISDLFMADEFEKEDSDISLIEQCDCTLIDKSPERIKKALEKKTRDNQYKIGDKLNTLFLHKAKTIITTTQFLNKFASSNITPKDYPGCSIKNISPEKLGCSLDLINKNLTRYFPPQNGRSIDLNDFRNMSYKRFLEDSRKNNHQCLQD